MININVSVEPSLDKVARAFGDVDLPAFIEREIVTKLAFQVERFSKQVTPVRTGLLRAGIGVSNPIGGQMESLAYVNTNSSYAIFVHEGTRYMRARPFMEWGSKFAVEHFNGSIGPRLDDHLREKLSRL